MLFIRRLSPLFRRFRSTVYCCQKIERCDKKSSTGVCARSVASSPSIGPLSICLVVRSSKMLSVFEEALCGAHFRHSVVPGAMLKMRRILHPAHSWCTQECCLCRVGIFVVGSPGEEGAQRSQPRCQGPNKR